MSCFQRANWHSGLTYRRKCDQCSTVVQYTDYNLDYRPWFADGFVYCPKCQKPLRHNEAYAIDRPDDPLDSADTLTNDTTAIQRAAFCHKCGYKFGVEDNFCPVCGIKRAEIE